MKSREGILCNSPKACFRELFSVGFIGEEEPLALLEMTDDRNLTSHTYKEEVSQLIYDKLPPYFLALGVFLAGFFPAVTGGLKPLKADR